MKVNLLSQISMTIIVDISSLVSTSLGRKQNYLCISSAICYDDATNIIESNQSIPRKIYMQTCSSGVKFSAVCMEFKFNRNLMNYDMEKVQTHSTNFGGQIPDPNS